MNLMKKGHAHLNGNDRGHFAGAECRSPVYQLSFNQERQLLIDGEAEPEQVDPGPTAEEQAAIDESDRIMREEREEYERKERELKERVERENREHNEKIAKEKKQHEKDKRISKNENKNPSEKRKKLKLFGKKKEQQKNEKD